MTPGSTGRGDLETLLSLQDLDTTLSQLHHRKATLPERAAQLALESRLVEHRTRTDALTGERDELAARQAEIERQVETIAGRRRAIEQRLYSARNTAARDLQAMDEEIRHLADRQSELEEAELALMVAAEPLDEELAALDAAWTVLEAEARDVHAALVTAESAIDADIAGRAAERQEAAQALPAALLARYEALRARMGGTGAARLLGNRCSGCHLELPSMEVDRIRHLPVGTVVTCDQCGRILVPASGAGPSAVPGQA